MASWAEVEAEAAELAASARAFMDAFPHKTLATLRRDGSPRISGIEAQFGGGELWLGCMWRSVKALDLLRDPRFALHCGTGERTGWRGDAKVAGRVEEIIDPDLIAEINAGAPPGPSHLFRADVAEVVVIGVGDPPDHLVIESWHAGRGLRRIERR